MLLFITALQVSYSDPNPFPSPNAVSETFVLSPGVVTVTLSSELSPLTTTSTFTVPQIAWTETVTSTTVIAQSTRTSTSTIFHPATTLFLTSIIITTPTSSIVTTVTNVASTTIMPIPSTTTTFTLGIDPITIAPGGTPVGGPLPSYISELSAITPSWCRSMRLSDDPITELHYTF